MCCSSCFLATIPVVSVQLFITAAALVYGQRSLRQTAALRDGIWAKRIISTVAVLASILLSGIGIFLFVLATNDDYRARNFAGWCMGQSLRGSPLDEHRCSILEEGGVAGKVLEFGPGPGTNFKCFQNATAFDARAIDKYVAVEPNQHFEAELRRERDARGLDFPLEFVGAGGEDADVAAAAAGTFDVAILTHVLCSVDSPARVLANAERALKRGGRIVFLEHVAAEKERSPAMWYAQRTVAPALHIFGNGCTFRDLGSAMQSYLGDRFDIQMSEFEASLPWFMYFARPHIKGVAIKR